MKSMGRQDEATKLAIIAQDLIGVPLAYLFGILMFASASGLIYGLTIGYVILFILQVRFLIKQDWEKISKEVATSQE